LGIKYKEKSAIEYRAPEDIGLESRGCDQRGEQERWRRKGADGLGKRRVS
jgi:hypothetical protein